MIQLFFPPKRKVPRSPVRQAKHRRASCTRKVGVYGTAESARQAEIDLNGRPDRKHPVQAYKCLYCPGFHVGGIEPSLRFEGVRDLLDTEVELGGRVWGCMAGENLGAAGKRRAKIVGRYLGGLRRFR